VRVLIVPNLENARAVDAARALSSHLQASGNEPVLVESDAAATGLDAHAVPAGAFGELDLVVALGGDGTILRAAHLIEGAGTRILGVNLGRLGFLSGTDGEALPSAVDAALAGEGVIENRCTLEVSLTLGGRPGGRHHALNEVFVGRGPGGRAVEMAAASGGRSLFRAVCDGMIVATATGSTAYALSAGGPVLAPDVRGLLLVPVSPHSLSTRPVVLGPEDSVTLTMPDPARAKACVVVDGDTLPCRAPLDRVDVTLGAGDVSLVRLDGRRFCDVLRETFFEA
jgi:NAD+ kinase